MAQWPSTARSSASAGRFADGSIDDLAHGASFVSVTQQFNTTTSMGRLTLNVLLFFAQFEREVTVERIRDKVAASKRKGLWVDGMVIRARWTDANRMNDGASSPTQSFEPTLDRDSPRSLLAGPMTPRRWGVAVFDRKGRHF